MDPQIRVAVCGAAAAVALAPDARTLGHARGDLDLDLPGGSPRPRAAAGRAGDAFHHGASAHGAAFAGKSRTAAGRTGLRNLHLNRALPAAGRLFQRDLEWMLDVLAALGGDAPAARALEVEAGKAAVTGEERVEEIAEVTEAFGTGRARAPPRL